MVAYVCIVVKNVFCGIVYRAEMYINEYFIVLVIIFFFIFANVAETLIFG